MTPSDSDLRSGHQANAKLKETFVCFFRFGLTGFGGPLALVASMQRDLIEKRRWMEPETFIRSFALIKAMPGPVAFQTAVFLGKHRAGWPGAIAAAFCLNAPAFAMMVLFGLFYQQWREVEFSSLFLTGMQAAALGVILASLKGLSQSYWRKSIFWAIGAIVALITAFSPASEPLLIVSSGALVAIAAHLKTQGRLPDWLSRVKFAFVPLFSQPQLILFSSTALPAAPSVAPAFISLAWYCFKAGAFVFGSGLAIVPMMEHDFVSRLGWLTHQEFMDALAFGQITPGPVVITATFIGYRSLGFTGAMIGTFAIFLAPFIHMTTWFPRFVDRLARLSWISNFLTGAIAAVVGAIAATVFQLGSALEAKASSVPIGVAALVLALSGRLPVWMIIPIGGAVMTLIGLML